MYHIVAELRRLAGTIGPVYHGSDTDIKSFDFERSREFGIHFGTEESASHRAQGKNQKHFIKKYELHINKPMKLDDVFNWSADTILPNMVTHKYLDRKTADVLKATINEKAVATSKSAGTSLRAAKNLVLRDQLIAMGYDGIEYANKGEAGGTAYIVFDGSQVREI